tara:strand:- start:1753 stop:2304 length:552 start_codon:yes stop_codon:yes gene_type:complete
MKVYMHSNKSTNEVFYVGIGGSKRPYSKRRSNEWKDIVSENGYDVNILFDKLSLEEAEEIETSLIKLYGRKDLGLGTLVNKTDGGGGCKGYKHTEEHKLTMKNNNLFEGLNHTPESKNKMSKAKVGRLKSENTKKKMSKAREGIDLTYNAGRICITNGEVIKMIFEKDGIPKGFERGRTINKK